MNRTVEGRVHYTGAMAERPRYYANDHSRDVLTLEERTIRIDDARGRTVPPCLEREGFALIQHGSAVPDFRDAQAVARIYPAEIERLVVKLFRRARRSLQPATPMVLFLEHDARRSARVQDK